MRLLQLFIIALLGQVFAPTGAPWSAAKARADQGAPRSAAQAGKPEGKKRTANATSSPVTGAGSTVAYVVLRVSDLGRSETFYRDVLGMRETFRYDLGKGVTEVAFGFPDAGGVVSGAEIVLLHDKGRATELQHGTAYSRYVIAVPNVAETFKRLQALGLPNLKPPVRYPQFKAIVCFAQDPDGYRIEILERIPDT